MLYREIQNGLQLQNAVPQSMAERFTGPGWDWVFNDLNSVYGQNLMRFDTSMLTKYVEFRNAIEAVNEYRSDQFEDEKANLAKSVQDDADAMERLAHKVMNMPGHLWNDTYDIAGGYYTDGKHSYIALVY